MNFVYDVIFCVIILSIAVLSLYVFGFRLKRAPGEELSIIEKGKINEENLKKAGMSLEDLCSRARLKGYFNIADVDYAILENNGEMSFMPKPMKRRLNPKDFNFSPVREGLCTAVVFDGELLLDNINSAEVNEKEIINILEQRGRRIENIYFATINEAGRVDVFEKQK